jgi:hypothetical protein
MVRLRALRWAGFGALIVACGACGGSSEAPPGNHDAGASSSGGGSSSGGASSSGGSSSGGSSSGSSSGGTLDGGPAAGSATKLDLLFMIDNSASMGDKQQYLEGAIPELVKAFTSSSRDMHIGIVSSSLGSRLSDQYQSGSGAVCLATSTYTLNGVTLSNHDDDQAHLLTRSSDPSLTLSDPPTEVPLADATPSGFLAWFPSVPGNADASVTPGATALTNAAQLQNDFVDLIAGVHEYGCGIESQLESWYRFLVQPDPYASLALSSAQLAEWVGVDTTILKQRHDFLRPDSVVVIVDLSDENDSEIDVRSVGGQGYVFMSSAYDPSHGTPICATNPGDPTCTSLGASDPSKYTATTDWGYDLNLRHVHMKAKYGIDPQFPIARYVNGLTSPKVPDRAGEYPANATSYVGTNDCTNPLFAASLPDGSELSSTVATSETAADAQVLCNLPTSNARPPNRIFFTVIGGVPWQLLHFDPMSATNSQLSSADWTRIIGTDPANYNYAGIDPHMIESYAPRTAETFATATPLPALSGAGGVSAAETAPQPATGSNTDPYNGREWTTNVGSHIDHLVDLEYACIFKLATPRDCSSTAGTYTVPANEFSCDCSSTGLTADELSPVCDPNNPTSQLYAKAYPAVRQLQLARALGAQAVVTSICPIDVTDNATGDDPLFGYRPAVAQLVSKVGALLGE